MTPENSEDVSFDYVPGSVGTSGAPSVLWAPRRTPASDRARQVEIEKIRSLLPKLDTRATRSTPVDVEAYREALAPFKRARRLRGHA